MRQRAGLGPPRRLTFLLVQESKQRTPPLLPTSLRFAAGNLRRQPLVAVRQNSLRAGSASLEHVAVKVMTMQLHSAVQLPAPRGSRRRRGQKGQYQSFFIKPIAVTAICISARSQFRHNSRRPSDPAFTRLAAPAARSSGCGHWHRRVPMLRALTCGNVFERSAPAHSEFCRTAVWIA